MSSEPKTNKDELTEEQTDKVVGGYGRVGGTEGGSGGGKENDAEVQEPGTLQHGPELE